MKKIDYIYYELCQKLISQGDEVGNTRELSNVKIRLDNIENNIVSIRNLSVPYLFGEWLWYFTGRNDVKFISQYGSLWEKLSDDGITNNSAYGYLIQRGYGFNQFEKMVELLKKDPSSRRAVINLNVPNENVIETKDEPCTIALQFRIRDNKLHCTGIMRSNDIWYGFPYDIAFFTELQMMMADELGVEYGSYTHFVTSLHVYNKDLDKIIKIISNPISVPIRFDRESFRKNYKSVAKSVENLMNSNYNIDIKKFTEDTARYDFKYEKGYAHEWKANL